MTDIYRIYHICMIHHSTSLSSQMLPSNWLGKTFSHWSFSHWSLVIGRLMRKVFLRWEMATRVHLEAGLIAFV